MSTYYYKYSQNNEFSEIATYALGINQNLKGLNSIDQYIFKAKKNNYQYFKIPFSLNEFDQIEEIEKKLKVHQLQLVVLADLKKGLIPITTSNYSNTHFEFVVDSTMDQEELALLSPYIDELISRDIKFCITIIVHRFLKLSQIKQQLSKYQDQIKLYFSLNYNENTLFLNTVEIHRLINGQKNNVPTSPWQVLWDHRIPHDLELAPYYDPVIESNTVNINILCSIIIPTFENKEYLSTTLINIFKQNYPRDSFEVLIIDDGSNDGTYQAIISLLEQYKGVFNFKYFYLPRTQRRTMGDARYRAGIARNFGKNMASGESLFFLDSDIIISPDYLNENLEILKTANVVQSIRYDLTAEASRPNKLYQQVQENLEIENRDDYWIKFHKDHMPWDEMHQKWKYLCTHSLCLKQSTFDQFGNFETSFVFYGFEDTDLGYKLSHLKFYLNRKPVYHLYHHNSRSEFFNSKMIRNLILARTAQIFYILHLDSKIFDSFIGYMSPEFSPVQVFKKIYLRILRGVLWKWPIFQDQNASLIDKSK